MAVQQSARTGGHSIPCTRWRFENSYYLGGGFTHVFLWTPLPMQGGNVLRHPSRLAHDETFCRGSLRETWSSCRTRNWKVRRILVLTFFHPWTNPSPSLGTLHVCIPCLLFPFTPFRDRINFHSLDTAGTWIRIFPYQLAHQHVFLYRNVSTTPPFAIFTQLRSHIHQIHLKLLHPYWVLAWYVLLFKETKKCYFCSIACGHIYENQWIPQPPYNKFSILYYFQIITVGYTCFKVIWQFRFIMFFIYLHRTMYWKASWERPGE